MPYWIDESAKVGNMRQISYVIDLEQDIENLPTSKQEGSLSATVPRNDVGISAKCGIGSKAFCIDNGNEYYLNSDDEWSAN